MKSFQQYFDKGVVYQRRQVWDGQQKNRMRSDGLRYLWSEMKYLVERGAGHRLSYVLCYESVRDIGLILGRQERFLAGALRKRAGSDRWLRVERLVPGFAVDCTRRSF